MVICPPVPHPAPIPLASVPSSCPPSPRHLVPLSSCPAVLLSSRTTHPPVRKQWCTLERSNERRPPHATPTSSRQCSKVWAGRTSPPRLIPLVSSVSPQTEEIPNVQAYQRWADCFWRIGPTGNDDAPSYGDRTSCVDQRKKRTWIMSSLSQGSRPGRGLAFVPLCIRSREADYRCSVLFQDESLRRAKDEDRRRHLMKSKREAFVFELSQAGIRFVAED